MFIPLNYYAKVLIFFIKQILIFATIKQYCILIYIINKSTTLNKAYFIMLLNVLDLVKLIVADLIECLKFFIKVFIFSTLIILFRKIITLKSINLNVKVFINFDKQKNPAIAGFFMILCWSINVYRSLN